MQLGIVMGKLTRRSRAIAQRAMHAAQGLGVACRIGDMPPRELPEAFFDGLSMLLAIGGDGTILSASGRAAPRGILLLGINTGKLGFLSEVQPKATEQAIARIVEGEYTVQRRMMLEGRARGETYYALNDLVLESTRRGRLRHFDLTLDGRGIDRLACDGLITSSPTGSTAYALSNGGPIIDPSFEALLFLPICAHSLRTRPLVLPPWSAVGLSSADASESALYADGVHVASLKAKEELTITKAPFSLNMARLSDKSFYALTREKLIEWSKP